MGRWRRLFCLEIDDFLGFNFSFHGDQNTVHYYLTIFICPFFKFYNSSSFIRFFVIEIQIHQHLLTYFRFSFHLFFLALNGFKIISFDQLFGEIFVHAVQQLMNVAPDSSTTVHCEDDFGTIFPVMWSLLSKLRNNDKFTYQSLISPYK